MGHGIDFGQELAADHRRIRQAQAAAPRESECLCAVLRQHVELLRRHVLPALREHVRGGGEIAEADEALLDGIEREVEGARRDPRQLPDQRQCRVRWLGTLFALIETQLDWEVRILLPLLEAETTWIVLEDLAEHARLARQRVTCEPA